MSGKRRAFLARASFGGPDGSPATEHLEVVVEGPNCWGDAMLAAEERFRLDHPDVDQVMIYLHPLGPR